jgi:hypothetical protein
LVEHLFTILYTFGRLFYQKQVVLLSSEGWARTAGTLLVFNLTLVFLSINAFRHYDYFILIICSVAFVCSLFAIFYFFRKATKANQAIKVKNSKLLGIFNFFMAILWLYNGFAAESLDFQFVYILVAIAMLVAGVFDFVQR